MTCCRTDCRVCGALLFTVTYTGRTPVVLTVEKMADVFFNDDDSCGAECGVCRAITPAPLIKSILGHTAYRQRVQ